jgi:alpha-D-ribose 1-methylphosphonate 5-triphosphate synthase subunit PhnH
MISAPALKHLGYGYDHAAPGSQQTFRAISTAMEHPGQLVTIRENPYAPDVLNSASAAICLTLLGYEKPVWTDIDLNSPAISWLQFGCGSSVVTETCMAYYAIITKPASMPALNFFRIGPYKYPEKETTIIVQVDDIVPGAGQNYSNILVYNSPRLEFKGISEEFWCQWRQLSRLNPPGINIFFTCDDVLLALPKIKRIE